VNKAGDCPRQVTGNPYAELRGGKKSIFSFFVSNSQQPAGVSAIKRSADGTAEKSEEVEKFCRNHFTSCNSSVAWHTALRSPALTVFVKKKFNYIKVIEKLPVTNAKTKFLFLFKSSLCRAGKPSTEQQSKGATKSLSTALPSPQVPGADPNPQG